WRNAVGDPRHHGRARCPQALVDSRPPRRRQSLAHGSDVAWPRHTLCRRQYAGRALWRTLGARSRRFLAVERLPEVRDWYLWRAVRAGKLLALRLQEASDGRKLADLLLLARRWSLSHGRENAVAS